MNRAWTRLALGVAILAALVVVLQRLPHRASPPPPAAPPPPLDTLTLVVRDGAVSPEQSAFPLGHRLALVRVNAGHRGVRVALAGYEHRAPECALRPGESRADTILLDLPGEDFAWRIDGGPVGKFRVAGSHLVEGHR